MKIAMIGQKNVYSRNGGVEVVVTELAEGLGSRGVQVVCLDRSSPEHRHFSQSSSSRSGSRTHNPNVEVQVVPTLHMKGLAALSSSFFGTLKAILLRPDVIHYHAEGPCVWIPLAKIAGIKTVATIHGLDWKRAKWGRAGTAAIRMGERMAARFADEVIVLSESSRSYFRNVYGRESRLIPNGVDLRPRVEADIIGRRWNLDSEGYVLYLGRIVPEKGLHLLLEAWADLGTSKQLVIAGGSSDTDSYVSQVEKMGRRQSRVKFVGRVEGKALDELYSNAYAYVLPSDVEGMPLTLLEAMSFGCACLTSNIPECADVVGNAGETFDVGSVQDLRMKLKKLLEDPTHVSELRKMAFERARESFDWNDIVLRTLEVYNGEGAKVANSAGQQVLLP